MFRVIREVLQDNKEIVLEMNSEEQLFEKGIDRFGVKISSFAPYSPATLQIKRLKGQPTNRVTLRDEGDFHFSFFIEFTSDGFEIKASDWKAANLVSGYGESILGLTDENFRDLAQNYVAPEILKLIKNI
jgi:hypothetical protein